MMALGAKRRRDVVGQHRLAALTQQGGDLFAQTGDLWRLCVERVDPAIAQQPSRGLPPLRLAIGAERGRDFRCGGRTSRDDLLCEGFYIGLALLALALKRLRVRGAP